MWSTRPGRVKPNEIKENKRETSRQKGKYRKARHGVYGATERDGTGTRDRHERTRGTRAGMAIESKETHVTESQVGNRASNSGRENKGREPRSMYAWMG